ncbi:MAG: gamma-glutamylcyclotransferase family protein [Pseudomonadota bacterium]
MAEEHIHLFVYGTLLSEAQHPMGQLLERHATLIGPGSIQARLYMIEEEDAQGHNTYPGAVPSPWPEDKVFGVVYRVIDPDPVFDAFNDFEACAPGWPEPYEFLLRPIDVALDSGEKFRAQSYLYTWDTSRATLIPSGRYDRVSPDVR